MLKIKVDDMSCGHCVQTVTQTAQKIAGVETVDVNLEKGEATITGNPDIAALIAAIDDAGFPARQIA